MLSSARLDEAIDCAVLSASASVRLSRSLAQSSISRKRNTQAELASPSVSSSTRPAQIMMLTVHVSRRCRRCHHGRSFIDVSAFTHAPVDIHRHPARRSARGIETADDVLMPALLADNESTSKPLNWLI
jgi:hypothetical protein